MEMTEYRRCQGKSYMIISSDGQGAGYEYPMITENKIPGLLSCQLSNENEKLQFWYEMIQHFQNQQKWGIPPQHCGFIPHFSC